MTPGGSCGRQCQCQAHQDTASRPSEFEGLANNKNRAPAAAAPSISLFLVVCTRRDVMKRSSLANCTIRLDSQSSQS